MEKKTIRGDSSTHGIPRRQFLAGAGSFLLTTGALGLVGCRAGSETDIASGVPVPVPNDPDLNLDQNRPNIVFILTDDHRWDHLSVMGHPFLETPHIDRLANEGVLFDNAFVTTSLCSPSRASFLTGKYARKHGVQNNLTPWDDNSVTFMEILAKAGYRNAFIGKWHMPGKLPNLRGVEQFITFSVQAGQGRYFDCPLIMNGETVERPGTYITEDLTDLAIDFINDQGDRPFCLYLSHKAAHHQFLPPKDLDGLYSEADISFLPDEYFSLQTMLDRNIWGGALGFMEKHYRNYNETLVGVDRELGRLVEALESRRLMENTVIIYAGDNGYSWGEHFLVGKRWASEENLRIPFIIRFPESLGFSPKRHDGYVLNVDLAPTIIDLAGLKTPPGMDGQSILSLIGDEGAAWRDAFVYEYFQDFPYNVPAHKALRTEQYLYVVYERGKEPELFDITRDPRTLENIINTPTGRAALPDLRQKLKLEEAEL